MLNNEKVKRAESQVKRYLEENLLFKIEPKPLILDLFRKNADESLTLAKDILQNNKSDLWVVVTSYYAMFYIANAVLYKKGFKVGNTSAHAVTANALVVYVKDSLKRTLLEEYETAMNDAQATMRTEDLIDSYFHEKTKRSEFQYNMDAELKRTKAETSFKRAKSFVFAMKRLLDK